LDDLKKGNCLKGAMREIFVTKFSTLKDAIWVGDLGTEPKINSPFCCRSDDGAKIVYRMLSHWQKLFLAC
jgi:hypothetical protein